MKIRTAAAELFHGDGQAGRPDESNSRASQFSNGPKKERLAWRPYLSARDVVSATNFFFFLEFFTKSCWTSVGFVNIGSVTVILH